MESVGGRRRLGAGLGSRTPQSLHMRISNRHPLLLRATLLAFAAGTFAFGGHDGTAQSRQRLEWDQQAASLPHARSLSFRLFVDDVSYPLTSVTCITATGGGGYTCTARMPELGPGRHVLHLVAVLNDFESPPSEPLVVSGDTGQLTSAPASASLIAPVPSTPSTACVTGSATECYAVRAVASSLSGVNALSPAPDGRLFFVEGNTRVRVVVNGALIPEPILALNDDQARIAGLAVDVWSFPENRFVFVAWTDQTQSGQLQLNVTRYREVANTLGEGATILTGIPVPRDIPSSIAVDRLGHVYVAVPALDSRSSSPESGIVLRITRDGRVPPDNRLGLPAFASGFSTPTSLFLDPDQRRIWVAGRNAGSPYAIGVVPTSPLLQPPSPHLLAQVASDQPVSLVLAKSNESQQPALFVLADGRLSKTLRGQDGSVAEYVPLDLGELHVMTAAATESGSLYVATETSIFELLRR
jgi:Glucose / Sorbosone dehydrogenase